jgi:kinetochore protein Mis12/MTW1
VQQRRLKRLLTRAVRLSSAKRQRSERRLEQLSFLQAPQVSELTSLPEQYHSMFSAVSSLPPLTPEAVAAFSQSPLADPGKRPWEVSKMGYLDWASKQVLARAQQSDGGAGSSAVGSLMESTAAVATTQDLRRLMEASSALDDARTTRQADHDMHDMS